MMELRSRRTLLPAMRALEASGDGYWEADLSDGTAWLSPWFYRKLGWPVENARTAFSALKSTLPPHSWNALLRQMRDHLEQGTPLDLEVRVQLPNGEWRWWRFRGTAQHNDIRHPVRLAGSMRDVTDEHSCRAQPIKLDAVLREIEPALAGAAGEGVALRFDLAAEDALVCIDAQRLKQALANMLLVAHKASAHAPEVTVSTRRVSKGWDATPNPSGDAVLLEVLDTQPGTAMRLWIPAQQDSHQRK